MSAPLGMEDIRKAHERIKPHIHRTPVLTSAFLDGETGARLFFKCENFQKTGAFKFRGACNGVFSLAEDAAALGVVTGSSGNHGQALACAARRRGIPCHVVMPSNAPAVKVAAVRGYGGQVIFSGTDPMERLRMAQEFQERTGATVIHPYNDPRVIAGQGTATIELIEEIGSLDAMLTPIGGGGLASGTSIAVKTLCPAARFYAAEPAAADDAFRSLTTGVLTKAGDPQTVADGLRTSLGEIPFSILRERAEAVLTVSEEAIIQAMRLVWERMKIVIEPSSAVPVAAVLANRAIFAGKRVGIILSGGNVDLDHLPFAAR